MAKKVITITEGRKKLFKIAEDVQKPNTYYTFTVEGNPQVVVMSKDEFDSWQETMEILSDPKLMKDIEQAEKDFKAGRYCSWEDLKKELGFTESLIMREKPKRKYRSSKK